MLTRRGFIRSLIGAGLAMSYGRRVFAEKKEPANMHLSEDDIKLNRFSSIYKNEISSIVKIKEVRSYTSEHNNSMQVDVECLAIDSYLGPFNLGLVYFFDKEAEGYSLLRDLKVDTIAYIKSDDYMQINNGFLFTMIDPDYRLIEPEFIEIAEIDFLCVDETGEPTVAKTDVAKIVTAGV